MRGIDIKVHVSLLILLAYLVFVVAARFGAVAREAGIDATTLGWGPTVWGFIISLALFVSIALHELGHALMGQSQGVRVRGITLMMLGGVSQMEKMPDGRYEEFKLAVVGPLVSFAIGLVLLAFRGVTGSADISFFCYWVGSANVALGIFNLLPAFPLDGGRALRSVLAARKGEVRATQISVRISRIFAWGLGILGLLSFNILLIVIAFFVYTAAQTELFLLMSRGLLEGQRARDVVVRADPVSEREPILSVAERMLATRNTLLPVATDSGVAALISLSDIRAVPRDFWSTTLARDVMEEAPRTLQPDEPIGVALSDLATSRRRALPVAEGTKIIGLVRYSDLTEILQLRSIEERKAA